MSKVILFDTMKDCITADKLLQQQGYKYRVIAIPASISDNCGMCIEVSEATEQVEQFLAEQGFALDVHDYR